MAYNPESTEPEIDIRTEPERSADDRIEALETELAALQPGVQVILERLRPGWCKGQLEKITIGDEGLDLDYLIRTWGGHLISIKIVGKGGRISGSHSVELYTFDPRRYGKKINPPNRDDDDKSQPQNSQPINGPLSADNPLLSKLIDTMSQQRQSEVDTLRALLAHREQQATPAPAPAPAMGPGSGNFNDFVKMAGAFHKLKDMFKSDQSQATLGGDGEEAFPAQMLDLVRMFIESKTSEAKPALTAPAVRPGAPPPSHGKITPIRQNEPNIAAKISGMEPTKAAETLITALGTMPKPKQEETMAAFMTQFQRTMPEYFTGLSEDAATDDDPEYYDDDDETEGAAGN